MNDELSNSIYDYLRQFENIDFSIYTSRQVLCAIEKDTLATSDLFALLSPSALHHLELMARRAKEITLRNFGRVISLYAPLYLSNYCVNQCAYCGYRDTNDITRTTLSIDDVRREAEAIAGTGIRNILILTGESRGASSVSYIQECVLILKAYFPYIAVEIYPLEQGEYETLFRVGVDGLTIYQETYDELRYLELHPSGPKRNFRYRLDTPDRAARARCRTITIGALMGLSEWRTDAAMTALHARYLENTYPYIELGVSMPRIRPEAGGYRAPYAVDDESFVQMMLAFRLFLPHAGITISTRERSSFRDKLIGIGATRMSAGSKTSVGGYADSIHDTGQFDVADTRSVTEFCAAITAKGYQPVMHDWQNLGG
ncbi:MAG: 2-iminoacetate synthase ThiH [Spirochaetes bacterium]|nr:2-iminoacetate synthase ThiH [Spirochaetota bacterium]